MVCEINSRHHFHMPMFFLITSVLICSTIWSLIESGFSAGKRSDVRLYYGARNLQRMAYQVDYKFFPSLVVFLLDQQGFSCLVEYGVEISFQFFTG